MEKHIETISQELELSKAQVSNVVELLFDQDCTIPFVARYRKERTGSLDEVVLRSIRDRYQFLSELEKTKNRYISLSERLAAKDERLAKIFAASKQKMLDATTKEELDDLYLPFKPRRLTKAAAAKEKGLQPLAEALCDPSRFAESLETIVDSFVAAQDENAKVKLDATSALEGAGHIIAEEFNENSDMRAKIRQLAFDESTISAKENTSDSAADDETKSKYENYFEYSEKVSEATPHRIMAVRRGETEKALRLTLDWDDEKALDMIAHMLINPENPSDRQSFLKTCCEDMYKRLLKPSIETELRLALKSNAESKSIAVFSENLSNLLLLPPLPQKNIMGVDPGIRTGSKLAVVDGTGKLLAHETVHPDIKDMQSFKTKKAQEVIVSLVKKYNVDCIAIGNGTGSREIDKVITIAIRQDKLDHIGRIVVNEAGASIYSTDEIAREEFPDLDPTIRSAVSIARRLQDPLAELVKIDPRSIGVGQYQHDVSTTRLSDSLSEVVSSCVNKVGVNINTASYKLLSYVSGIGPSLAKKIVMHRDVNGNFLSRDELKKVKGFGDKVYQQAAGFLRVPTSSYPLDNSAVHPESYSIVEDVIKDSGKELSDVIGNALVIENIDWEKYVTDTIGLPSLYDISEELKKPGRDPRSDSERLIFSDQVCEIRDLKVGMELPGCVSNVTNFGAFVDIGVHQDGLVHLSEIQDEFVSDASEFLKVGQIIKVKVIGVDSRKRRISLSMKQVGKSMHQQGRPDDNRQDGYRQGGSGGRQDNRPGSRPGARSHRGNGGDGRSRPSGTKRDGANRDGGGSAPNRGPSSGPQGNRSRGDRNHGDRNHQGRGGSRNSNRGSRRGQNQSDEKFTMDDLLKKFGRE